MLSSWRQAFSLALLTFNVTRTVVGSDIESDAKDIVSSVEGDLEGLLGDFEDGLTSDVVDLLGNSDGVLAQFTLGHQTTPPISAHLVTSGVQSNVTIGLYCESCQRATRPAAFNFASQSYSGWNSSWLGFALDSFEALFEIDVDLSAVANGELTLSLLKIPATADGVGVEVDFQLYLLANASASMSFTAGLNLTLTNPAAIMMPALDPTVKLNQSQRIGFDQHNFILAPIFNASIPQLDFGIQFSLRTIFSITVEDYSVGALYLDLPAFSLTVSTLTNAMSNCQTPPAGTSSDEIYAELIHLHGALVAVLGYEVLDGNQTGIIETWTIWDVLDECYAFFPGLGSIGAVPASSRSPLLTAPATTTCMTGDTTTTGTAAVDASLRSLSAGAKAGAVIGTLVGVMLIIALAWYGGRASLSHSIKNGGTSSVWVVPRPRFSKFFSRGNSGGTGLVWAVPRLRFGKLFSRGNDGGTTKFSFIPPSTSAWQTTAYERGVFLSTNAEAQQQFAHQGWQMEKEEPFVDVNDRVTPASTYISIGDDYSMPTAGVGETGRIRSQPTKYEGGRARQAEGLGQFQGGGRPAVQMKDVLRKPLPRYSNGSSGM